jgi:hypothetical protein
MQPSASACGIYRKKEIKMKVTKQHLRRIIREELLAEGDVVPVDFKSGRVRKTFTPHISDVFIFSGDAGQLARVIEMSRDPSSADGGRVVYEQYVEEDGEWIQDPAQTLTKSLLSFNSRYSPYAGTIEHINSARSKAAAREAHMEREMASAGFPDYKNSRHEKSAEYMSAFRKAISTAP